MGNQNNKNDDSSKSENGEMIDKRLCQFYGDFNWYVSNGETFSIEQHSRTQTHSVSFKRKYKGRWNPWQGAIHYQISLSPIRKEDAKYVVGKDPFLHFVYAEHGYVLDSKRLFVRTLSTGTYIFLFLSRTHINTHTYTNTYTRTHSSRFARLTRDIHTVYEGEAKVFGKSIVLYSRKELQKCMRVDWGKDGLPSAKVISEQICVISPASRLLLTSSRKGTLLTLRKEKGFCCKLWKSDSKGGIEERRNLDRLQAQFGSKLQWISEKTHSIPDQISISEARSHYKNLDHLMEQYDPSLGDGRNNSNDDHFSKGNDESDEVVSLSPSVDMFVARDLTKPNQNEGQLLAVRDAATGEMIGLHDLAKPFTFPKNVNTRRDSWTDRCVSPIREVLKERKDEEFDDEPVYEAVICLLGGTLRSLRRGVRVKWSRSAQLKNDEIDDENMFVLTPPPNTLKRGSSRVSSCDEDENVMTTSTCCEKKKEEEEEEEEQWGDFSAMTVSKDGFPLVSSGVD